MSSSTADLLPRDFPGGRLRRLREGDLDAFQAYRHLPDLGRYQGWSPMSDDKARQFLLRMNQASLFKNGEWVQLGIAEPEADRLIGDIGLRLSEAGREGEIGITLQPSAQGRGLATAAMQVAIQLLFVATSANEVLGVTDTRNAASIRLLERVGFRHRKSRDVYFRGEPCSERVYALGRMDGPSGGGSIR
jgi:aminoglycoside 6'-N-acetyltransferase